LGVTVAQTNEAVPQARRSAPYWEWVEMYRRGIEPAKIAEVCGAASSTVRYHLQIAAKNEPGLRGQHAAAMPVKEPSEKAMQRMQDLISFYQAEGRLPAAQAKSSSEQTLASWLYRRRRESAEGTLSPALREGLSVIPGWDQASPRKAEDEARWQRRLREVKAFRKAGVNGHGTRKPTTRLSAPSGCGCTSSASTTTTAS